MLVLGLGNEWFLRYLNSKSMISHRRNVKFFLFFLQLCLWVFIDFNVQVRLYLVVRLGYVRLCQAKLGQVRWLFCSNMDLPDHAQILHTGVLEGEEFNERSFSCRKLTVLEIITFKINELPYLRKEGIILKGNLILLLFL